MLEALGFVVPEGFLRAVHFTPAVLGCGACYAVMGRVCSCAAAVASPSAVRCCKLWVLQSVRRIGPMADQSEDYAS
jgi:hypothetical protein